MTEFGENERKRRKNQQFPTQHKQQPLYSDFFNFKMSSNDIKFHMDGFYTSRAFQRCQEHQIWSPNEEVMQVAIHEVVRCDEDTLHRTNQKSNKRRCYGFAATNNPFAATKVLPQQRSSSLLRTTTDWGIEICLTFCPSMAHVPRL